MRKIAKGVSLAIAVATVAFAGATAAAAKCTKLAFSVNDYGKDGPIRDAKDLLDKYIANWAKEKGVKSFTVGKKDVSCELFLDFIVFDEHTCKATAVVCWPDGAGPATPLTPAAKPVAPPAAKPALQAKPKAAAAN